MINFLKLFLSALLKIKKFFNLKNQLHKELNGKLTK